MIRVVVTGVAGRMGQRLAALTIEAEGLELVGGVEAPGHAAGGSPLSELVSGSAAAGDIATDLAAVIGAADVVIAFTTPSATLEHAAVCAHHGRALVVGTTGMNGEELAQFKASVDPIACVFAPNFSTAMNVLFSLVEQAAGILGDEYDVEVVEAHHRHKVDARVAQLCSWLRGRPEDSSETWTRSSSMDERGSLARGRARRSACTLCAWAISPAIIRFSLGLRASTWNCATMQQAGTPSPWVR